MCMCARQKRYNTSNELLFLIIFHYFVIGIDKAWRKQESIYNVLWTFVCKKGTKTRKKMKTNNFDLFSSIYIIKVIRDEHLNFWTLCLILFLLKFRVSVKNIYVCVCVYIIHILLFLLWLLLQFLIYLCLFLSLFFFFFFQQIVMFFYFYPTLQLLSIWKR